MKRWNPLFLAFVALIAGLSITEKSIAAAAAKTAPISVDTADNNQEPLKICIEPPYAFGPNGKFSGEVVSCFKSEKRRNNANYENEVIEASSIQEAKRSGCDLYVDIILGPSPDKAEVASVYSKKIMLNPTGIRRMFGGVCETVAKIGAETMSSFAPGTSNYKKVKTERDQYLQRQQPQTSAQSGISKDELKSIVQAAVEGATRAQQKETKTTASVSTDIDRPSFSADEKIMGDNDLSVIIGIEGYSSLPKSDYSYDDAKLVKDYVKALGFKERNIELITDEKATKTTIEKSLEVWLKNKAKSNSRIFVYYSGHGSPDPTTGEAYIVPYDGDPNYLSVTGYPLKRLYEKLGNLPASEVIVVLDACFSGAGGRSVLAKGARPLVMMNAATVSYPNMVILSATQGSQISTSSSEKGHGVFTYYFLKALKSGRKNLDEIYEYLKPQVEDEAKQLNVQQSPSMSAGNNNLTGRFYLRK
jgi:hypothetical protein